MNNDEPQDIFKNIEADMNRHADENEALCRVEGDHILIPKGGNYQIDLNRCDTYQKIVWWVSHLTEKPWVDRKIIELFVGHACMANGLAPSGQL